MSLRGRRGGFGAHSGARQVLGAGKEGAQADKCPAALLGF